VAALKLVQRLDQRRVNFLHELRRAHPGIVGTFGIHAEEKRAKQAVHGREGE
jgi:hypothetical protein